MTNKSGLFMDFKPFTRDIKRITGKIIPDKAERASFQVGWIILRDAMKVPPKAPREIGDLHASGEVHPLGVGKLGIKLGFNKVYAAKWHELTAAESKKINWSLSGSGRKYLENKLVRFKDKYIKFIAEQIHA